jgi:hypothetical protein
VVLSVMALLHGLVFTYFNSQGFTHHGNQIISLILCAQALVVVFFPLARRVLGRAFRFPPGVTRDGYLLYMSQAVIAGVYLTSVWSKMDESDGRWIQNLPNISVQLIKTHRQEFYTDPAKTSLTRTAEVPSAQWMIRSPFLTRLLLGGGLFLEALVWLGLAHRGWALVIGGSVIVMHLMIGWLMKLYFDLNAWASLIFFINLPYWALQLRAWAEQRRAQAGTGLIAREAPPR